MSTFDFDQERLAAHYAARRESSAAYRVVVDAETALMRICRDPVGLAERAEARAVLAEKYADALRAYAAKKRVADAAEGALSQDERMAALFGMGA